MDRIESFFNSQWMIPSDEEDEIEADEVKQEDEEVKQEAEESGMDEFKLFSDVFIRQDLEDLPLESCNVRRTIVDHEVDIRKLVNKP
jgi:hypothetical protein